MLKHSAEIAVERAPQARAIALARSHLRKAGEDANEIRAPSDTRISLPANARRLGLLLASPGVGETIGQNLPRMLNSQILLVMSYSAGWVLPGVADTIGGVCPVTLATVPFTSIWSVMLQLATTSR